MMKVKPVFFSTSTLMVLLLSGCSTFLMEDHQAQSPPINDQAPVENQAPVGDQVPSDPAVPETISPNVYFDVQTQAGTCPEAVGMWAFILGFEGGADHTVVVDTEAIATLPVEILQSEDRRIIYQAPLQEEYASCVGTAQSERLSMYSFNFGDGKVRFELDLTGDDGYREIRYADTSTGRPYVHWQATE
ncbi:MAG: hypothetical protein VKK04_07540 [Synechococcales bacterium]|nr:hypothetical protein [Synechococcales bacterium]